MYKIKYVRGHYEVFLGSRFIFSADSKEEALREIEELED